MSANNSFPRMTHNVVDISGVTVGTEVADRGLFLPLFISFAEKGEVGQIHIGSGATLRSTFGEKTFLEDSKYKTHVTPFAKNALTYTPIAFMRVCDDKASGGTHVLEAHVTKNVLITQYQKDDAGNPVYDADGNRLPKTDSDGITLIQEPGVRISYKTRELEENESYKLIPVKNITDDEGNETLVYPIISGLPTQSSPGSYINYYGYRLYFNIDGDTTTMNNIGSLLFSFEPVYKDPDDGLVSRINTKFGDASISFSFDPDAYDTIYKRELYFDNLVAAYYKEEAIPFGLFLYPDNVKAISQLVYDLDKDNDPETLTTPMMVNIFTGRNWNNIKYDHMEIGSDSLVMTKDVVHFFSGGSDGDMNDDILDSMVKHYLNKDNYPDITDSAKYPFTHLSDSGFGLEAKKAMIALTSVRGDVAIDATPFIDANGPNDKQQDYSLGVYLRSYALLFIESELYNTPHYRTSIYQQAGKLISTGKWAPLTLDRLQKRCVSQAKSVLTNIPDTLETGSAIEMFSELNWTPSTDDQKQMSWDNGLNYAQHYDVGACWHFAGDRTIYPDPTSLLSDTLMRDLLVYIVMFCRKNWSKKVGSHAKIANRLIAIQTGLEKDIHRAMNGHVTVTASASVEEALNGQKINRVTVIDLTVYGNAPDLVWKIKVPVANEE